MNIKKKNIIKIVFSMLIVLIILLAILLNIEIGENGLIKIKNYNKQKYTQQEIRQKVEIAITNTIEKERALGNDITVGNILQELVENDIFESIDKEENIGNIQEYQIKLKEDASNIVIEDIIEVTDLRITYKLEPMGYTNSEKVGILFKVQGKVKSITKPDGLIIYPHKEKLAIDYEVNKNGIYPFIIENEDGTSITKNVIVDTIDKLSPPSFEIIANMSENTLTISHEVKDNVATEESACSGIERYEYYIKGTNDTNYKLYNTNRIENLEVDTYLVYAIVYDKAGNYTNSSIKTVLPTSTILYDSNNPNISQWDFKVERDVEYGISNKLMYLKGRRNGLIEGGGQIPIYYNKGMATTNQIYNLSQYNTLTVTISEYSIGDKLLVGIVDENEEWIIQKTPNTNGKLVFSLKDISKLGRVRIEIDRSNIFISKITLE
ncbi:MAG: hypothetical protein HFJ41_05055 [Clostridia bacterium]|nr:hypothetical protein [Clostridia bacterium]